ncbi:MAG: class B sortase [Muricoprocola sp.]
MAKKRNGKKSGGLGNVISTVIMLAALAVFCFAGYKLVTIYLDYKTGVDEYTQLQEYTGISKSDEDKSIQKETYGMQQDMEENDTLGDEWGDAVLTEGNRTKVFEEMENPIDFESLESINEDIIGWLEMEAVDTINYPVVQGVDNEYYLHRTFQKTDNFAGSIFLDCVNKSTFVQRNSILYGHNMKNGSMFGSLKQYRDRETFEKSPYFWIYTPNRIYKYEIFACAEVDKFGPDYQISFRDREDFEEFIDRAKAQSLYDTGVDVKYSDTIVTLSTCTGNEETRFIVQGKRVRTYVAVSKETGYENGIEME